MPNNGTSTFILVSGFHRSGTSLVAKTLEANGVSMGNSLMGASFANKEGHYEDIPLVNIHDAMLAANGTNWQEYSRSTLDSAPFLYDRLQGYVDARTKRTQYLQGAKDPRALFFSKQWNAISNTKVKAILVFRNWQYSVSSLLKRHSRELLQTTSAMTTRPADIRFWKEPELAVRMWIASAKAMLAWYDNAPDDTIIFPLSALIKGNNALPDALGKIGLSRSLLNASGIIKPNLLHTHIPHSMLEMIPLSLREECDALNHKLYAVYKFEPNEKVTFFTPDFRLPCGVDPSIISQVNSNLAPTNEKKISISFSNFSFQEAIQVINSSSKSNVEFDWEYLLNTSAGSAGDFDTLFTTAVKKKMYLVAELAIRKALDIQPASWRWMHLGDLHRRVGKLDDAEKCYQNAIERTPENATFYARLAEIAVEKGLFLDAESFIQKAKDLDETKPAIVNAVSRLNQALAKEQACKPISNTENDYRSMPVIRHYSEVVEAMTQSTSQGAALDEYMVKSAFVLRDNLQWFVDGLNNIPQQAQQSLTDYLSIHAKRYWSETVLNTEFQYSNKVQQYPQISTNIAPIPPLKAGLPESSLTIGVHVHVFYPELLPEIYVFLSNIPFKFSAVVTCPQSIEKEVYSRLANQPYTRVVGVENKGRDIAPWLLVGAKLLRNHDVVLKLHTKSTPHASALSGWRLQLLWNLLGSVNNVGGVIQNFIEDKNLAISMPLYHPNIVSDINWGGNKEKVNEIAQQLGINVDTTKDVLPFPAGSMFWYRPDSLHTLLDYKWDIEHFPEEEGQTDGTLMHAIERLIPYSLSRNHHISYLSI